MVRKIPYSIGYVDFSYAIQTKMTFAAIAEPHSDKYIIPSIDSISHTVNTALQIQNISNASQTTSTITTLPPLIKQVTK
jgi:ABC-type phosphate transport system substrate-binding protein